MFSESLKESKHKFSCKYWGFGIRKFGCFDDVSKIFIIRNNELQSTRVETVKFLFLPKLDLLSSQSPVDLRYKIISTKK